MDEVKPGRSVPQLWNALRKDPRLADPRFVEHLGALLLRQLPPNQWPKRMPEQVSHEPDAFKEIVDDVPEGERGRFFDGALFLHARDEKSGEFPLPRHIARLMADLCKVKPGEHAVDFACGSGGLLLEAARRKAIVVGVEIRPQWADIASTNLALHGVKEATIEAMDAFDPRVDVLLPRQIHVTLLAPPFRRGGDTALVKKALGVAISRDDTALAWLSLMKLAENGRCAFLAPETLLSGADMELKFREFMLAKCHVRAVVALPPGALLPFSSLQTYLILATRQDRVAPDQQTWFIRLQQDGYTEGKQRDLNAPPKGPSDLPLVQALLDGAGMEIEAPAPYSVRTVTLAGRGKTYVVQVTDGARIAWVERGGDQQHKYANLESVAPDNVTTRHVQIGLGSEDVSLLEHAASDRAAKGRRVHFAATSRIRTIVIAEDGTVLAVAADQSAVAGERDLLHDMWLPRPIAEQPPREASAILKDLREGKNHLDIALAALTERLGPPNLEAQFPPQVKEQVLERLLPFPLPPAQTQVWEVILGCVDKLTGTPQFFTLDDLRDRLQQATGLAGNLTVIVPTLDLLRRAGAVLAVTHGDCAGYRLATGSDYWNGDQPGRRQEGEHEAAPVSHE